MKPAWLCLVALFIGINVQAQTTVFPFGSSWQYLDDGTDQVTAWRSVSFSDANWKSGPAPLGYGEGDEATVVNGGYITTYFRKVVNIQNPEQYAKFILEYKRDDGAIVFINGTKRSSSNMPTGTITYLTHASTITTDDGNTIRRIKLNSNAFVNGDNTIAVEVHQAVDAIVDLSFDLRLFANLAPVARAGSDKTITLPTNSITLDGGASTDADGIIKKFLWTMVSGPTLGSLTTAATVSATASGLSEGAYVFRLTVTDNNGSTGSDDVFVNVNQQKPTLFVEWKNIALPADGLPDGRRWASDRLRSSTAFGAFSRVISNDKLKIAVDSQIPVDPMVSSSKYHYRAEFTEWPWRINLPEGTEQWFGWSYHFPADYVRAVSPISIFQNHAGGTNSSPAFQLELTKPGQLAGALGGEIQVINNCSSPKVRKLTSIRPNPGDRIDIICHVVHALDANGLLEFWINGIKIHEQIGSTIYPAPENWGGNNKWGIYHHTWTDPTMVLQNIAAGHTKFELLMGNLRQITRSPADAGYLSDSKAIVDPAKDLDVAPSSARTNPIELANPTMKQEGEYVFSVYPLPVVRGQEINIRGKSHQTFEMTLINQTGQTINKFTIHESATISTMDMPVGLYIFYGESEGNKQRSKIIIIE